jgi:hypothetical protein
MNEAKDEVEKLIHSRLDGGEIESNDRSGSINRNIVRGAVREKENPSR